MKKYRCLQQRCEIAAFNGKQSSSSSVLFHRKYFKLFYRHASHYAHAPCYHRCGSLFSTREKIMNFKQVSVQLCCHTFLIIFFQATLTPLCCCCCCCNGNLQNQQLWSLRCTSDVARFRLKSFYFYSCL